MKKINIPTKEKVHQRSAQIFSKEDAESWKLDIFLPKKERENDLSDNIYLTENYRQLWCLKQKPKMDNE